jgi:hypothetical protein|nr:MAG TPA: acid stress chaperone [Caudoviricetes sp.]
MKTLALKKIEERRTFILKRVKHRYNQYISGLITCEDFARYEGEYRAHFVGYARAFWDMELLTDEEYKSIISNFTF